MRLPYPVKPISIFMWTVEDPRKRTSIAPRSLYLRSLVTMASRMVLVSLVSCMLELAMLVILQLISGSRAVLKVLSAG